MNRPIFTIADYHSVDAGKLLLILVYSLLFFKADAQVTNSPEDYFKQNLLCVHNGSKGVRFVFNEECLDTVVNRVDSIFRSSTRISRNSYYFWSYDRYNHLIGMGSFHLHEPLGTWFEAGEGEELVRRPYYKTVVCVTSLEYFDPFNCLKKSWYKLCHYNSVINGTDFWGSSEWIRRAPGRQWRLY
jgi:hypothetical protein